MSKSKINDYIKNKLDVVKYVDYSDINFKRIAIDASNWVFATFSTTWSSSIDSKRLESNTNTLWKIWFSKMFLFINTFLSNNILPIMIFDGVNPTPEKALTRLKRRYALEKRNRDLQHAKETKSTSEYLKQLKSTWDKLPTGANRIIPNFFRAMGVRVIMANNEAELLCSLLQNHGLVDMVWSADADNLAMGCQHLIRGWDNDKKKLKYIQIKDVLRKSGLSFHAWVDFFIIMGCDYNSGGIYNYGGDKCMNLIKTYKCYRNIPEDVKSDIFIKSQTAWLNRINKDITKLEETISNSQGYQRETAEIKLEELVSKVELVSSFTSLDEMVNYDFCVEQFGVYDIEDVTDSSIEDLSYNLQVDPNIRQYVSASSYEQLIGNIQSFHEIVPEWFTDNNPYIFDEDIGGNVFEEADIDDLMN